MAAMHYEIWKYCQSTSRVQAYVLENLRVQCCSVAAVPCSQAGRMCLIEQRTWPWLHLAEAIRRMHGAGRISSIQLDSREEAEL